MKNNKKIKKIVKRMLKKYRKTFEALAISEKQDMIKTNEKNKGELGF